jgi:pyrroline-5-carboxylate reductase
MNKGQSIAILGVGNIGSALAKGLLDSKFISPSSLTLTRRNLDKLSMFKERGCIVTDQNIEAVQSSGDRIV